MSNGDTIIICKGVGEVTCKNTVALPHYANGIVTAAIDFPHDMPAWKRLKYTEDITKHVEKIQKIIAKATGGQPYEFTGDPNSLPECPPHP